MVVAALGAGLVWLGYRYSPALLTIRTPNPIGQVVILPGGGFRTRSPVALELMRADTNRLLLVTGTLKDVGTFQFVKGRFVPSERLILETNSMSTWQNAQFSAPLLRERRIKSAIIVTDWLHTRRILSCFRRAAPDIQFSVVPAYYREFPVPNRYQRWQIMTEYIKIAYYALRYQVIY